MFDPSTGETLTRDAEAGAALTRMATQDREEQIAQSSGVHRGVGAA
ncbi:hypothetical protein [Modestobacter altitudinis]|nr:hypothetical protein [Modestobacter altitudinis]